MFLVLVGIPVRMVQCSTALDQQLQTSDRLQLQSAASRRRGNDEVIGSWRP